MTIKAHHKSLLTMNRFYLLHLFKNSPAYNHSQSSNEGDGQASQNKYVNSAKVKQTESKQIAS